MQRKPLLTLFVTIFIDLLGFGIIIPILPVFAKKLAIDSGIPISPDVAVGWVAARDWQRQYRSGTGLYRRYHPSA